VADGDLGLARHLPRLMGPGCLAPAAVGQSCLQWYGSCKDRGLCSSELASFFAALGQGGRGLKIPTEFMAELMVAGLTRISYKEENVGWLRKATQWLCVAFRCALVAWRGNAQLVLMVSLREVPLFIWSLFKEVWGGEVLLPRLGLSWLPEIACWSKLSIAAFLIQKLISFEIRF